MKITNWKISILNLMHFNEVGQLPDVLPQILENQASNPPSSTIDAILQYAHSRVDSCSFL